MVKWIKKKKVQEKLAVLLRLPEIAGKEGSHKKKQSIALR